MAKTASSIRLSPLGDDLWRRLSKHHGLSQAALIEMLMRQEARQQGMDVEEIEKALGTSDKEPVHA